MGVGVKVRNGSILLLLALGGCATAGFQPPAYSYTTVTTTVTTPPGKPTIKSTTEPIEPDNMAHVQSYLRGATYAFDQMLRQSERLKLATELPIIAAGVFAPTWLALGKSTDGAIYAAGVGAAGGALSNYLGLRDRGKAVAAARSAISCVNREYVTEMSTGLTLAVSVNAGAAASFVKSAAGSTLANALAASASTAGPTVGSAGQVAIAAADEIISKLKVKLAGMGSTPDYAGILKDLQDKQKLAEAQAEPPKTLPHGITALTGEQVFVDKTLQEYPVRIAICVAKVQ